MTVRAERLSDRGIIRISGPDAQNFLQGVITNDLKALRPGRAQYSALLTPQGKYLYDFILHLDEGSLIVECERERTGELLKRFTLYRLRAKADIQDISEERAVWWSPEAEVAPGKDRNMDDARAFADPRLAALGTRIYAAADWRPDETIADGTYRKTRIGLGVGEGTDDMIPDKTLALEANLDALNGLSFTKGCFVGQEIAARMRYRGKVRKRLLPVSLEGEAQSGAEIVTREGRKNAGDLRSTADGRGVALLRIERLEDAPFQTESGALVHPGIPDWLRDKVAQKDQTGN